MIDRDEEWAVDRLERAGYVRRERDPDDRRKVVVRARTAMTRRIAPLYDSLQREMTALWSRYSDEELALVLDFLTKSCDLAVHEIAKLQSARPEIRRARRDHAAGRTAARVVLYFAHASIAGIRARPDGSCRRRAGRRPFRRGRSCDPRGDQRAARRVRPRRRPTRVLARNERHPRAVRLARGLHGHGPHPLPGRLSAEIGGLRAARGGGRRSDSAGADDRHRRRVVDGVLPDATSARRALAD